MNTYILPHILEEYQTICIQLGLLLLSFSLETYHDIYLSTRLLPDVNTQYPLNCTKGHIHADMHAIQCKGLEKKW